MDNTTPAQTQQSTQSSAQGSKKKLIMIAAGLFAFILVGVLGYFAFTQFTPRNTYEFTINSQNIPEDSFRQTMEYYAANEEGGEAIEQTKNLFIENNVLKQLYLDQGGTQEELDTRVSQQQNSLPEEMPSIVKTLLLENEIMNEVVSAGEDITTASGIIFAIRFTPTDQQQQASLTGLATAALSGVRTGFAQGQSIAQLQEEFNSNTQLQQEGVTATTGPFENMTPSQPTLPGDSFAQAVFDTPQASFSNIFDAITENVYTYGVVYITQKTEGEYTGYQQWLQAKVADASVTFQFQNE